MPDPSVQNSLHQGQANINLGHDSNGGVPDAPGDTPDIAEDEPEKSEAKMICVHRLWMLVKPAILPVLRIIFISLVTFQYVKPRSWSTRKYAVHNLQICLAVLCLLTTAQIVIYLWPAFLTAKKRFTKKPYQKKKNKRNLPYIRQKMDTNSRLNKKAPLRTFYDVITIITNITFIVSSIMGFKVALVDNCFEIGQKNSSFMDEFLTKTQKLVLFPALLFLLDFAFAAWDSISLLIEKCSCGRNRSEASVENNEEILSQQDRKNRKKEGKKTRPKVRRVGCLIRDILKAAVSTMSLLASIFAFTLYKDGVCVHQLFSGQCPPMRFRIEALSHFHLSITSTVMFPSSLGTQTHTETFKVTVNSFLLPTSSNKDHIKCNDGQGKRIEDKHGEITCAYDAFEDKFPEIYETHNSQQLGTANGILLQWPCNVISQFRHVRKSVECFFRIQIQVNEDSDFTYNSDVVYKLNESVPESIATLQKWNKISKYGSFSSIFNTDSEQSYRALRSLLSTLDDTYESLPLDTPSMDLMASEPHFLHFNCNRSCACYECVADLNVKKGPKCQLICPNVDSSKYSDHSKNLFCQPDNPDRCEKEWIPISTKLNSDKESVVLSDRVNYQEAPKVTVVLPSGRVEAKLDEKLQLPNPSDKESSPDCKSTRTFLQISFGIALCCFPAFIIAAAIKYYYCWQDHSEVTEETQRHLMSVIEGGRVATAVIDSEELQKLM